MEGSVVIGLDDNTAFADECYDFPVSSDWLSSGHVTRCHRCLCLRNVICSVSSFLSKALLFSLSVQVYPMFRKKRGIFLLISNKFFKQARANHVHLIDREGTQYDCNALDSLFEQLGFEVERKTNCTVQVARCRLSG